MSEERGERRPRPRGGRRPRRKVCSFCVDKIEYIDYKDINRLRRFTNERGTAPPDERQLRQASASAERGHQARTCHRLDALHGGIRCIRKLLRKPEQFFF